MIFTPQVQRRRRLVDDSTIPVLRPPRRRVGERTNAVKINKKIEKKK